MAARGTRKKKSELDMLLNSPAEGYHNVTRKLDETIQRFTDAIQQHTTIMASHAQRLDTVDKVSERLHADYRDLRATTDDKFLHLNTRIDSLANTVTAEIQNNQTAIVQHIDRKFSEVTGLSKRVRNLEHWKWVIFGGAVVVMFVCVNFIGRFFIELYKAGYLTFLFK